MADETAGRERRSLTWLWMLLAIVTVTGFLTWLGVASEPSAVAIVEAEPEEEIAVDGTIIVVVPKDTLALGRERFLGQVIRVPRVEATGMVGPQLFWGELGDQMRQVPMLVKLDSALLARGVSVRTGASYSVTGRVVQMTDSILEDWSGRDVLADEGARLQAEFADYFLDAENIRPAPGAGAAAAARTGGER